MSAELTLEEAALAWAQKKRVEAVRCDSGCDWVEIDGVGKCEQGTLSQQVFGLRDLYRFRLAPEPPVKKFRPWTPEEVPVGAWFRKEAPSNTSHCWMIAGWNAAGFFTSNEKLGCISFKEALEDFHSLDNGKTWLPCGVEVDA